MASSCRKSQQIPNVCKVGTADISYANPNDSYVQSELNLLAANLMQFSGYSKCHLVAVLDDNDWQF
jgi:hypothetical protein